MSVNIYTKIKILDLDGNWKAFFTLLPYYQTNFPCPHFTFREDFFENACHYFPLSPSFSLRFIKKNPLPFNFSNLISLQ